MQYAQYAQGDLLFVSIALSPDDRLNGDALVKTQAGRYILAQGEKTGHAHSVSADQVELFNVRERRTKYNGWGPGASREAGLFMTVSHQALVTHDEHAPLVLPAGTYQVIQQREYVPEAQPAPRAWD